MENKSPSRPPSKSPEYEALGPSALLFDKRARDIFGLIQREYIYPQDKLTLRKIAKGVEVVGDRHIDKLESQKEDYFRKIKELQKMRDEADTMTKWFRHVEEIEFIEEKLIGILKKLRDKSIPFDKISNNFIKKLKDENKIDDNLDYYIWEKRKKRLNH